MITNNYFLNLNIDQGDIQETDIKIVQNDYNANTFDIHIFNGDVEIDYTDVDSGIIIFRNAYKDIVKQGNLVKGADKLTYTLESINFDGDCICGVQLYGVNDERISTTYFKIKIVRDLISEKSVKTDSNYDALLALKNDLETIDVVDLRNDVLSHQAEMATYIKETVVTEVWNLTVKTTVNLGWKPKLVIINSGIRFLKYKSISHITALGQNCNSFSADGNGDLQSVYGIVFAELGSSLSNNILRGMVTITETGLEINWELLGTVNGRGNRRLIITAFREVGI